MTGSEILDFSARVLEREGAIVAPVEAGVLDVVLPAELSRALGLEEFTRLVDGMEGGRPCGYGSDALRRIASAAVGAGRAAAWRTEVPASARRAPELAGLNVSIGEIRMSECIGWMLCGTASYRAACDDERLGLVDAAVTAPDGVAVPAPRLESDWLTAIGPEEVPRELVEPAYSRLLSALRGRVADEIGDFRKSVARRAARDAERLESYFRDVAHDLRRRARRRGGEGLEAKRAALPLELEARMAQLEADCRIRVELNVVALAALVGPAIVAEVEVRRRKHRKLIQIRYDGITRRWSGLRCDGCGATTSAFAMCDEAEHVLCGACWDACGTGGHRQCFRCAGKPEEEPWARAKRPRPAALAAPLTPAVTPPALAGDRLRDQVLGHLRKYRVPLSIEEIQAWAGGGREALERALSSLVERGMAGRLEGPRATLYFARGP